MAIDEEFEYVERVLADAGLGHAGLLSQTLGTERIFVVSVAPEEGALAAETVSLIEEDLSTDVRSVLVTVRTVKPAVSSVAGPFQGLQDPRVSHLIQLLTSRSRTSEAQPSLNYIPNNTANLAAVTGTRHHLVFGRRGAGKTALLLESKRIVEEDGHVTVWVNMQPHRDQGVERSFLHIQSQVIKRLLSESYARSRQEASFAKELAHLRDLIDGMLDEDVENKLRVRRIVPRLQDAIKLTSFALGIRVFVFIDDFYYIPRADQPDVLDLVHATARDSDVWLKIASVRHLTRWFRPSPPTGLQTGQDADLIDLDLSLQDPSGTIAFLEKMFLAYCRAAGMVKYNTLVSQEAFERLVFASGGVPRDFLTLVASATTKAKNRSGARSVGVTEVNQAAGDAAQSKLSELEDDLAANSGFAPQAFKALSRVRDFCLDEKGFTYFRVDFRDRDRNPDLYAILTRLLEVRLLHLIDGSVSDKDRAGERSECFTLDLSQYSGSRLKQKLRVLDLKGGRLISKQTRVSGPLHEGVTPRQVLGILRGAPQFPLGQFDDLLSRFEPGMEEIEAILRRRTSATIDEIVIESSSSFEEVALRLADLVSQERVAVGHSAGIDAYRWIW